MAKRARARKSLRRRGASWTRRLVERLFRTLTGQVVVALTALTVIVGSWVKFDAWVAKAEELRQVEASVTLVAARLDQWKLSDDRSRTQQRLWQYVDRYGDNCERAEKVIRDECRNLREQIRQYDEQLKKHEPKK